MCRLKINRNRAKINADIRTLAYLIQGAFSTLIIKAGKIKSQG